MQRFKRILVAATPGRLARSTIRLADELARTNDATLTVMDVVAPLRPWQKSINVDGQVVDIEKALFADRARSLRDLVDDAGAEAAEVVVGQGEPFLQVIRRVLIHDHDLVMLGVAVDVDRGDNRLSSGVMHVLRKCPVPVWVLRDRTEEPLRVLALVDPDPDEPVRDRLADLVMTLSTSLASRYGAELHVGNAWRLEGESALRSSPYVGLPGDVVDAMVLQAQITQRGRLLDFAARHGAVRDDVAVHLVAGAARDALPRLAARLRVGLIVMGTVGRTGLRGLIMGNTAETILRSVDCSVLAVKPDGFVSPVTA